MRMSASIFKSRLLSLQSFISSTAFPPRLIYPVLSKVLELSRSRLIAISRSLALPQTMCWNRVLCARQNLTEFNVLRFALRISTFQNHLLSSDNARTAIRAEVTTSVPDVPANIPRPWFSIAPGVMKYILLWQS